MSEPTRREIHKIIVSSGETMKRFADPNSAWEVVDVEPLCATWPPYRRIVARLLWRWPLKRLLTRMAFVNPHTVLVVTVRQKAGK